MRSNVKEFIRITPLPGSQSEADCKRLAVSVGADGSYLLRLEDYHRNWARTRAKKRIRGLGDVVWLLCHFTGIERLVFKLEKLTGRRCGCSARRARWNRRFPLTRVNG